MCVYVFHRYFAIIKVCSKCSYEAIRSSVLDSYQMFKAKALRAQAQSKFEALLVSLQDEVRMSHKSIKLHPKKI